MGEIIAICCVIVLFMILLIATFIYAKKHIVNFYYSPLQTPIIGLMFLGSGVSFINVFSLGFPWMNDIISVCTEIYLGLAFLMLFIFLTEMVYLETLSRRGFSLHNYNKSTSELEEEESNFCISDSRLNSLKEPLITSGLNR